ncbi:hypothetical protein PybrP1_005207 [[Pythium] brassicae (nom. inval.)]|nr:hypothetical protein PybrP1_005207 [[Pythium] brassicae (nom. inval.)]
MKSFVAAAAVALALAFAAPESASAQHFHLRVHASHTKLYITPLGEQCAYNASIDPAEYPCREGGVCVRLNATFGECRLPGRSSSSGSRENGAKVGSLDSDDSVSDDEDDEDDDE